MLNALLDNPRPAGDIVAKQRLIFSMKHIIPWIDSASIPTKAALSQYLSLILPSLEDIYGDHWTQILHFITHTWAEGLVDQEASRVDNRYVKQFD